MSLLSDTYKSLGTNSVIHSDVTAYTVVTNGVETLNVLKSGGVWVTTLDEGADPIHTISKLDSFVCGHSYKDPAFELTIGGVTEHSTLILLKHTAFFCELDISMVGDTITLSHNLLGSMLVEEPNSSLMYHKLFPDVTTLRDLENIGYTFKMGAGLAISKQHYATSHRGSKSASRRSLQTIIIMKDGNMFRKMPKAKWVQLVDPSDKDSITYGVRFMKQLLKDHTDKLQSRWDKLKTDRS